VTVVDPITDPIAARRRHDVPGLPDRPISVEEYHARIADGTLVEGSPYELLEGWVVEKMPQGPSHTGVANNAGDLIRPLLPPGWVVRIQSPTTTDDSEPELDFLVARGSHRNFLARHPGAAETAVVGEVSDSSVRGDRSRKARVYARAGYQVYWIVNLPDRRVEVNTDPVPGAPGREARYAARRDYLPGESVPLVIDGVQVAEIPVAELLP
jgi:Uma2 family endonuclease